MKAYDKTGYLLMKEKLTINDRNELTALENICKGEKINLKLELGYKLSLSETEDSESEGPSAMKEYFYYINDKPVSYLGICSFGGSVYELNGMTHPDYRRKGLFRKLYEHALLECKSAGRKNLLLLTDGSSASGNGFIEAVGALYAFSESRMTLSSADYYAIRGDGQSFTKKISLREALLSDKALIHGYDKILYPEETTEAEETEAAEKTEAGSPEDFRFTSIENTYVIEEEGRPLGKIRIDFKDKIAFIYGFGILPEARGQGYGKAALREALSIIFDRGYPTAALDVETKNDRALTIYTGNGFRPVSVMKYYEVTL